MFTRIILLVALSLILLANHVACIELIELNDANKNVMHIDDSKALETIQTALENEMKFKRVQDARNFIVQCKRLSFSMEALDDEDYEGLAAKIKALLREEPLLSLCHIKTTKLDEYSLLDDKEEGTFYLSPQRINGLIRIGKSLERHPKIKQVLGYLYEIKSRDTGKLLVEHAAEDTSICFGELDESGFFQTKYHSGCSISTIKPICKLVRGQADDKVTAYGSDLVEFTEAIIANDQVKLTKRVDSSGVTMETLESSCKSINEDLYPIHLVKKYKEAGYLDESRIAAQKKKDLDFNFYIELEILCNSQRKSA